ncbi:SH3 domain-containing protein [Methylocystis sp. IM3]|uniref:SH3 domain-containing protein n=1 Tax=unclassified Methylocystis TaxID=2625913 RepID=UPI0030F57100
MRRSFLFVPAFFALVSFSAAALADVLTLQAPVELRTRPSVKCPVTVIAPADTEVTVLGEGRDWIPLALNGQRFFASRAAMVNASPAAAPGPDPTCDYGYPYSGSGLFFARPLAQLRHGAFGFLLGTHRFYPC